MGNPVCLWQTELFKLNLKSSPSPSGHNRRRRLAPRSSGKQQAERTAVRAAPIVCPEESPLLTPQRETSAEEISPVGNDAPTPARGQGLQPYGALTLFFRWRKKSVQKKASGTATPEVVRPAARNSQISAFRALPCPALVFAQACQSLTAFGSCAHWAHAPSRPKLRPAVALRAVLVLGSLRSPAGKKPFIAHFDGMARYVARSGVDQIMHAILRARSSPFSAVKMGGPFSLRCLSPLCSPAVGVGHAYPLRDESFQYGWVLLRRG